MTDKYNVTWYKFTDNLQLMFKDLYEEGKHSDVTLVCDDQTQFKAHKIVLRACSMVFKKIIDNNPTQHPLIYLRGIQSYELEPILQFMYLGEGRFFKERMLEFIKVAKDLEVKEIGNGFVTENKEENITEETVISDDKKNVKTQQPTEINITEPRSKILSESTTSVTCPECGVNYFDKSTMLRHYKSKHECIKYSCSQCDYIYLYPNLLQLLQ